MSDYKPAATENGAVSEAVRIRKLEREVERLREEKWRAEEMSRLKSAFLAHMSHEIRTPLTSIIGFSSIMVGEAAGDQQDLARMIERNGNQLLRTLNAILDLSILEAGSADRVIQDVDVNQLALECVDQHLQEAEAKGLTLAVLPEKWEVPARVDEVCLVRVLNNLLATSVLYTDRGGISVEITEHGGQALLRVRDTSDGIGHLLPLDLRRYYSQCERDYGNIDEGAGLALAITKRIVELMGGRLGVDSRPDKGTVFTLSLPRSTVAQ